MSNLVKLEFLALDISGQNYLSWAVDAEIYLAANGLGDTFQAEKETTIEQKAKAMIFLRHHLQENLNIDINVRLHYIQSGSRGRGSDRGRGRGHSRGRGCGKWRGFGQGKGVEVNLAYQDEKIDNFDIDSFGIDSLNVVIVPNVPK
ncbi:hypothetical protein Tco_1058638 [Tanacetum coccineum]|uniref:Uncharacterized protein n=1 Tax=Tanacetum coccineum TaxID=301880 RepID=A0ABQ5H9Q3_9ASTR